MTRKPSFSWFRLNRNLHRDFGYFAIALTIVFAVSGIALNHVRDWNPNYIVERQQHQVSLSNQLSDEALNQALLSQFDISDAVKASYWESPNQYNVFFDGGGALRLDFKANIAVYEKITARPVFKEFNTLHLNEIELGWIVVSDIYAGILIFLAISGLFMVKGKNSPWRLRKGWLVLLGTTIPVVYIVLMK